MIERDWPSFRMMIGKIVLRVACERADLIEIFLNRYAGFITDSKTQMDVSIKINQEGYSAGLSNVTPDFSEVIVVINAAGYRGFIDLARGFSEISLPAQRLIEDTEYFLRLVTALVIFRSGGLMLHAAGIAEEDKMYVFFGHSGTGKSTVARNSPGKQVLNDDLLVLLREGGVWNVYSTPFWNPTQVRPSNLSGRVYALYQLVQDKQVTVEQITPGIALAEFLANVPVINGDRTRSEELLERSLDIITSVPVYHLHFLPDDSFWDIVKKIC